MKSLCTDNCPKVAIKSGSKSGANSESYTVDGSFIKENSEELDENTKSTKKIVSNNNRSPSQRQKTVQIVGVISDSEIKSAGLKTKESPQRLIPSSSKMSRRNENSSTMNKKDWNSTEHNPCDSNCPLAKARDRAMRKAELRQERLDNYLLTKGFRYFDDLCTCSLQCLSKQLIRDKFVISILKSTFLFAIGIKLCEELDSWKIY